MEPAPAPTAPVAAPKKSRLVARLALLAGALAAALFLVEAAIRVVAPQNLSGTWRVLAPRGYPVNKPGGASRHVGPWGDVSYRFNAQHLRGSPLGDAKTRVLCLGDSFTFGWGLDEPDTYVARMQRMADARFGPGAFEFENGGCGGWGTAAAVAFLEDFGDAVRPRVVVMFLNSWDVGRSLYGGPFVLSETTGEAEPRQAPAAVGGFARGLNSLAAYQWLLEHSHLVQFARATVVKAQSSRRLDAVAEERDLKIGDGAAAPGARSAESDAKRDAYAVAMGRALFLRAKRWCDAHGATLLVVTTGRVETPPPGGTPSGDVEATLAFKKTAAAFFAEHGVAYDDIADDVAAARGGRPQSAFEIPGDGHSDAEGARLIAEAAWKRIEPRLAAMK